MRADAPGKLVLSGAYAVLEGAPALVTAVDRRVHADTEKPHDFEAPEVLEGLKLLGHSAAPPWYDASALRNSADKLGLGSSAAICVASLGAVVAATASEDRILSLTDLRNRVYPLARTAHRRAQGGGSGIDVAAACFGETLDAQLDLQDPTSPPIVRPVTLPSAIHLEVWASRQSASTPGMVRKVFAQKKHQPKEFERLMGAQHEASAAASEATTHGSAEALIVALRQQAQALFALGELASISITLPDDEHLIRQLTSKSAFLPSGAGGGDVNLYIGLEPSPASFRKKATQLGLTLVPLSCNAVGLQIHP